MIKRFLITGYNKLNDIVYNNHVYRVNDISNALGWFVTTNIRARLIGENPDRDIEYIEIKDLTNSIIKRFKQLDYEWEEYDI